MDNQISRRSFMKRLAAVGVLLSTASLPTFAEDKSSTFSKRGRFERLSVGYATIHIGLQKPFSIMHISDTHLTEAYPYESEKKQTLKNSRTTTFGGRQEEALRDSLEWAKSHVDYIVHTGDLIDWQSEANFDLVKKYFGTNIFGTLGNHEFSSDMWLSEPKEGSTEAYKEQCRNVLSKVFPF
jgi:predicted MPP superfamily phosphohydrolase